MKSPIKLCALLALLAAGIVVSPWSLSVLLAQDTKPAEQPATDAGEEEEPELAPEFTEDYLKDPANIAIGQEIWQDQCRHCHGSSAYPGKAPKLRPKRYKPDFVFDRVTNGFRKMPAWKEAYTREERMGVVAWVLSKNFSP